MNIGIIDADLIGKQNHNFPNLACMKISGYHKELGDEVNLISYADIRKDSLFKVHYDKVYISKAFMDTIVPLGILGLPNIVFGGTGFYFDEAPNLPDDIEHHMPDYKLYDKWIAEKIKKGKDPKYFKYYTDYSMGYTTRGCIRKCQFCVNRNSKGSVRHSLVKEFNAKGTKKICLIDDNILAHPGWEEVLTELIKTKKPFQYNQGLDIRLLTLKKAEMLVKSKYDGDYIFAFDNYDDKEIIIKKLTIFKSVCVEMKRKIIPKLYVLCDFDRAGKYDKEFWYKDLVETLERIKILFSLESIPYIMKYMGYGLKDNNPHKHMAKLIKSWANATAIVKMTSINEHYANNIIRVKFANAFPEIADKYFNMKLKK